MTIICIKDGAVAADGGVWCDDVLVSRETRKIIQSLDGAISGSAGNSMDTQMFRRWFGSTVNPESRQGSAPTFAKEDGFSAVWLERDGAIWQLDWGGKPYRCNSQGTTAIGAAKELALGAMYAGAFAEQAVRICVERHGCAGGEVFVERLELVPSPIVESDAPEVAEAEDGNIPGIDRALGLWNVETPSQMDAWRERMGLA
jgi:hypothetical protein